MAASQTAGAIYARSHAQLFRYSVHNLARHGAYRRPSSTCRRCTRGRWTGMRWTSSLRRWWSRQCRTCIRRTSLGRLTRTHAGRRGATEATPRGRGFSRHIHSNRRFGATFQRATFLYSSVDRRLHLHATLCDCVRLSAFPMSKTPTPHQPLVARRPHLWLVRTGGSGANYVRRFLLTVVTPQR